MKVLKFGGTSVANAQNIKLVLEIVKQKAEKDKLVVVVSALSKVTDMLQLAAAKAAENNESFRDIVAEIEKKHLDTLKELIPVSEQSSLLSHIKRIINHLETLLDGCFLLGELSPRTADTILSFGELLSSYIIAQAYQQINKNAVYKDSRELIKTNNDFGKAVVNFEISNNLIQEYFTEKQSQITILPGFIALTLDGITTTLGRGGSDYTAAIIAGALDAEQLEIWTDVNGMFTANPKIVKQAQPIATISYQEAMELSHFGAKVLYPPTIQPVLRKNIPILIKNTFEPEAEGTLISNQVSEQTTPVKGISHIDHISLLTLEGPGMIGVSGSSKRLIEVLSHEKINVIFITQASSEHSICIGILNSDAENAEEAINKAFEVEILQNKIDPCIVEKDLCIIALVGENMKNHQGLSGRMFSTLGKNNVNIRAIAQGASERNISAVINERDVKKALNTLHENFFEENTKQLNLFVMGVGNVGEKFIEQIHSQKKFLKDVLKINVRVIALSNSRKMFFDEDGISLKDWQSTLDKGEAAIPTEFIARAKELNLRN
ncbi:MAG TPA: aspartate kinase, partial [Flavobacterium sp.]|uniref:aspartate kinase n=1 Tax=Flavobacterium sp. TaxID=239 RepID=UPI002ED3B203